MAEVKWTNMKMDRAGSQRKVQAEAIIRAEAILTTSYVDTAWVDTAEINATQLTFLFKYTKGSLTSAESQVWASDDAVTWYQEPTETIAAGTITETPTGYTNTGDGNWFRTIPVAARYYMLKVKGTGTATGSLMQIKVIGRW